VKLFESSVATCDFLEDFFYAGSPYEWRGSGIPSSQEVADGLLQIGNTSEDTPPHRFLVQLAEPPLDQVEPTRTGGNEVQNKPGMSQPSVSGSLCEGRNLR
jgi:hypothetical protein